MRLTTIKLAGFKSFVDPTTLQLPTNMTGVVGPNGCGKSNVIDAVRWVMGESAATRLRGEALTDVIFSGSSDRKPVGQATVELVFDNADGSVQGEFARYSEISVKRAVTREGQSQYYLNGAKCRRRDITDLFLGTGLGPRSYSIVEQGMISQIIEAKPEELRTHLEEAAGISKYKERRRETENRIRATRENLDRVQDLHDEVDKQLEHLDRQARNAERWQALKAEHTHKEAALNALQYRELQQENESHQDAVRQAQVRTEELNAEHSRVTAQLETARTGHQSAGEHLNEVQAEVYRIGGEVARVEQQIQHNRELKERLENAAQEAQREHDELTGHIQSDREQAESMRQAVTDDEPRRAELEQRKEATAQTQQDAETRLADWQETWDRHTRDSGEASRAAEVERTRLDYLDRQAVENARRRETLETELAGFDIDGQNAEATRLSREHEQQQTQVEQLTSRVDEHKQQYEKLVAEEGELQASLDASQQQLQSLRGRLASLEALQKAALGEDDDAAGDWLQQQGLADASRLGTALTVDAGWEQAVEAVLAGMLDAVVAADGAHALAPELADLQDADLALVDAAESDAGAAGTLAAHARGPAAIVKYLATVKVADNVGDARTRAATLDAGESIVTAAGEWFGPGWVRVQRGGDERAGVLARERDMQQLRTDTEALEQQVADGNDKLQQARTRKRETETARDAVQNELHQAHRKLSELAGQVQSQRGKADSARERNEKVRNELNELSEARATLETQTREARANLDQAVARMSEYEDERTTLETQRRELLEAREEARLNAREAADQAQSHAVTMESRRTALTSLEQALERMDGQLQQVQSRQREIQSQLEQGATPVEDLEAERQSHLDQRLKTDKQLAEARSAVEAREEEYRQLDQERQRIEQQLGELREQHSEKRLAAQALEMRAQQAADAVSEADMELETLLAELPDDADADTRRKELESLNGRITRLEPVNLAAIQEHEEQTERKQYLDSQLSDLHDALGTLEDAIHKIDRETRQMFKQTFEQVDAGVRELFPRLFGGGQAYLEMTGEDLLDTGVALMARPPGKRVSNISLLSGGEKAMTAVTLVFSIFRLNPAPFCLLDEVDAPLDEANVGRFSNLVKEMSENVQFILISHNKATMEEAQQLCGVTMREAGVSRLVQVDLAEASRLAGAA